MGAAAALPTLSLAFQFPGSEGDRTYVSAGSSNADGWANRRHPLTPGFSHNHTLEFSWSAANESYAAAVTRAWRAEFAAFAPRAGPVAPAFVGGAPVVITAGAAYEDPPAVLLLAPRVESGGAYWVLLGEVGKAVSVSQQRLAMVVGDGHGSLLLEVLGAAGEAVVFAACQTAGPSGGCGEVRLFPCSPGTCKLYWK